MRKIKRWISLWIIAAIVFSIFSTPVYANTVNNEYIEISTAADLLKIENNFAGKYILKNDIVLEGAFAPLGSSDSNGKFSGVLDGNGYAIKNLCIVPDVTSATTTYGGLFAYIKEGTVKNLTLSNVSAKIGDFQYLYFGAIAGMINKGKIINCSVDGEFSFTTGSDNARIGGIMGRGASAEVSSSVSYIDINYEGGLDGVNAGGIAGDFTGSINACGNSGDISINGIGRDSSAVAGGIVSKPGSVATLITDSINRGIIKVNTNNTAIAGGIIGEDDNSAKTNLENNLSLAKVTSKSSFDSAFNPSMATIASGAIAGIYKGTSADNYYLSNVHTKAAGSGSITASVKSVAELRAMAENNQNWKSPADQALTPWISNWPYHIYENDCDTTCNDCGLVRQVPDHIYDNSCDEICNICGNERTVNHDYEWIIDEPENCGANGKKHEECKVCHAKRNENTVITATGNHDYEWIIDEPENCGVNGKKHEECKVCHAKRNENTVITATGDHKYDNDCDKTCDVCGASRTVGSHKYTNNCDTTCNNCGAKRTIKHSYLNDCDKSCNVCGASRSVGSHKYTNSCDTSCNECKATRSISHSYKTTTTKATTSKNGSIVKKCSVCGKVSSTTTIYRIKSVSLSTSTYTYNGKTKKPSVKVKDYKGKTVSSSYYTVSYASGRKSIGKYKVTVTFKGNYSGSKTLYFKINPQKVSSLKLKSSKKKELSVSWKKDSKVSGYEIVYATNSKFTKSKKTVKITSYKTYKKTIKKLSSKKTYYVKVRAYKTVKGTKYYGSYCSYKKLKIK